MIIVETAKPALRRPEVGNMGGSPHRWQSELQVFLRCLGFRLCLTKGPSAPKEAVLAARPRLAVLY